MAEVDLSALRRTAFLLCGNWPQADEIVQRALTRAALCRRRGDPASLRDLLVRCWSADRRPPVESAGSELVRALLRMPPRQRGCVVLRYWERCTVAETAALLGCSAEVVRRDTTKGLQIILNLRSGCDLKPD